MKRILIILVMVVVTASIVGCDTASEDPFLIDSIKSYRDVPGVTEEEISAIEGLKSTRENFSYGHLFETEAFILSDGTYAGFTTDFCKFLSSFFDIEFVQQFCDWNDLKDGVNSHSIDFTGELTQTPERMQFYYMTHPIAERSIKIFTHKDSEKIVLESDINGLKIGFLKDSIDAKLVMEYYPSLSYKMVDIESFSAAADMLKSGEIDVFVTEGVVDPFFDDYDFIVSKDFFPLVYIPVSLTTANPDLEPIISVINKYINAGGIDNLYELYKEGDYQYAKYKLNKSFSDEEKAYLNDLAVRGTGVSIALEHDNYPLSFYNEQDNEFQGIALDILAEISQLTGIKFKQMTTRDTPFAEIIEKLSTGKISMVTELLYSEARANNFNWSAPYYTTHYTLISKSDYPSLEMYQVIRAKVGTIDKTGSEEAFYEWFPDSNAKSYATQYEGLDALERGEVDLLVVLEHILLSQINYRGKPGYKVNIRFDEPIDSMFGFNKDEVILCSIINKAQYYVNIDEITNNWTSRFYDYSKELAIERANILMIFTVILFFILVIVLFLFLKNKQLNKKLEMMACMDALTNIFNRRHFVDLALIQMERVTRTRGNSFVIIFDLDHFKQVNDNYGHTAGDEVLKSVAMRVKNTIRPYDLFARYGGEEFILFVVDVDKEAVLNFTERIRLCISETPFEYEGINIHVSASFGIAFASPINDLDTATRLADEALYEAKSVGRNRVVFYDSNRNRN